MAKKRNLTDADLEDIELRIESAVVKAHASNKNDCKEFFDMRYKTNGIHAPMSEGVMFDGGSPVAVAESPNNDLPFYYPTKIMKTPHPYYIIGIIMAAIAAYLEARGVINVGP